MIWKSDRFGVRSDTRCSFVGGLGDEEPRCSSAIDATLMAPVTLGALISTETTHQAVPSVLQCATRDRCPEISGREAGPVEWLAESVDGR